MLLLLERIVALALDVLSPDVLNAVAEEVARTNSILCSNNGSFELQVEENVAHYSQRVQSTKGLWKLFWSSKC